MGEIEGIGASGKLRREAKLIGLLFASTTSMIGSGWLFGAYHASKIAGPLSVWSWVVGAVIIMLIALCFAELGALFPRSGALVHIEPREPRRRPGPDLGLDALFGLCPDSRR